MQVSVQSRRASSLVTRPWPVPVNVSVTGTVGRSRLGSKRELMLATPTEIPLVE